MAMQKLKTGDTVVVITGKDKGQTGRVLKVFPKKQRLLVEGVNMVKKHVRPNPNKNEQGGIITREASVHWSNVAAQNPATKKADRIGIKSLQDGTKVRYFKSTNEVIED